MKVIIVHGSNPKDFERMKIKDLPSKNERGWIGLIKDKLIEKGIECIVPLMPESWAPLYEKWKNEFEKINIDEESILVGTSAGAAFLLKYLSKTNKKIKKLILIAPVMGNESSNEWLRKEYGNFKISSKIQENVEEIIIFVSDNDRPERLESAKIMHKELGGKLIELKGRGHFIEKHMGTKEFPELFEEILK